MSSPVRVLVTGAAGQIAYSLIPIIARGDVFGSDQPVILHLLDIPVMATVLNGVVMEILDCAYPLVLDVVQTTDEAVAFKDIDAAFLVGSMPRKEGMERKDLLSANGKIFQSQGKALAAHAKSTCKILVVGNPANTNALICSQYASPKIPLTNFTAMTRLDHNRTLAQLSLKHKVPVKDIQNVIIWGNHSSTQFPDVSNATANGQKLPFSGHNEETISLIQKRGASVLAARKLSSAMSAAKAAADHMKDWWQGTSNWISMGVISDGNKYGVPDGLIFSFPVTVCAKSREWKIVEGLTTDEVGKKKIEVTIQELLEEKQDALSASQAGNL